MNLREAMEPRPAADHVNVPDVAANGEKRNGSRGKPERAMAVLGRGHSVIVIGHGLTLDKWIKTAQQALARAKRAKSYGLELDSFLKMLRDMSGG
jgi:hypothetical protein